MLFNHPGTLGTIGSIKIIEDITMVEPGEPIKTIRSWKERLFTWPWKPLKKYNVTIPMVPNGKVLRYGDKMIMHPATADQLRKQYNIQGTRYGSN